MTARYLIGDVHDRMAELEPGTYDLACGHPDTDPTVWHDTPDGPVCADCCTTCNRAAS